MKKLIALVTRSAFKEDHALSAKLYHEVKPFIIPGLHPNPEIQKLLIRSYSNLLFSKSFFILGPVLLKYGINMAQEHNPTAYLLFLGYGVCFTGITYFQSRRNIIISEITQKAIGEILAKTFQHLLNLDPQFHMSDHSRARLFNISKAQQAVDQNLRSLNQFFIPLLIDLLSGMVILLGNCGWQFCLIFMVTNIGYTSFTIKYSMYRKEGIQIQRKSERRADLQLSQALANYLNVKVSGTEEFQTQKYQETLNKIFNSTRHNHTTLAMLNSGQRLIFTAGLSANLLIGTYFVLNGHLSTGDLVLMQSVMLQMMSPLFFLGVTYRAWFDSLIDIKQLYKITDIKPSIFQRPDCKHIQKCQGRVALKGVSFRYTEQREWLVRDANLQVQAGQFVAFVGSSGVGKSTLISLIFRLFDPQLGQVLIDGQDIRQLSFSYRKNITVMPQYHYLTNTSAAQNLLYGTKATLEQAIELCKKFNLHSRFVDLPNGYDTLLGQKGNSLSGGQKQRVCIIRSLLRKSKIVVLDQPTSALDSENEGILLAHLQGMKDCTRIVITHNPRVMGAADKVFRLKEGRIQ